MSDKTPNFSDLFPFPRRYQADGKYDVLPQSRRMRPDTLLMILLTRDPDRRRALIERHLELNRRVTSFDAGTGEPPFMGCDIHVKTEVRKYGEGGISWWVENGPDWQALYKAEGHPNPDFHTHMWDFRDYDAFACLAETGRRPNIKPLISKRGWPDDWVRRAGQNLYTLSDPPDESDERNEWVNDTDFHTPSWYTLSELLLFNYDTPCSDQPITVFIGDTYETRHKICTYREVLDSAVLSDVERLRTWATQREIDPEDVRIVFCFDN